MLNFVVIMAKTTPLFTDCRHELQEAMEHQILILDGAMGTMLQLLHLTEDDFHKPGFTPDDRQLKGCNDILCVTAPEKVEWIHRKYINAGAQIIETDSFNANAISLSDYGMQHRVKEINIAAAKIARHAADTAPHKVWVAGSIGPTNKSLSMAMGTSDAHTDSFSFKILENAYFEQICALIEGGVDLLLFETIFDTLNAKAAVTAMQRAIDKTGQALPCIISVTLTECGRTLSGQSLDAFIIALSHAEPLAIGLNCGFGAEGMKPYMNALASVPCGVILYPNAGLPNAMGEYDETPQSMAEHLRPLLAAGRINIIGGCCGTTPEHIAAIAEEAAGCQPRIIPPADTLTLKLSGLDILPPTDPAGQFIKVGERCNVAGSRKFLRLINEGNLTEAMEIARGQINAGASVIDINMDDAMLDAPVEMLRFLKTVGTDPDVSRVPLMIDSSHWKVITEALNYVQGKAVVNSISLKEGEDAFLEKARYIASHGAAMIVMAFDEQGQADNLPRRIEICSRAYKLLTGKAHIPPADIIFDPNILTVATGMEEHRNYALDFLNATRWIKENLPGAKVSGGLSNLSFAFRGNNFIREAIHAVFLRHAVALGLDMAIVNPSAILSADTLPQKLVEAIDDVLLNRRDDATDRLVAMAADMKGKSQNEPPAAQHETECLSPDESLSLMIVRGETSGLEELLDEALTRLGSALAVIDGPLMEGMNRVGELFGQGRIFLPQVVKSAHAMKCAVAHLTPTIEQEKNSGKNSGAGKMILATVKGDVHDIGKNIVSVIMSCNGFNIIDLGVMVPADEIVGRAIAEKADMIGLSGLITPSLEEMCVVARLMEEHGLQIPLMVGGAATSPTHTAVKIAPCYSGPVIHTHDAASLPAAARLYTDHTRKRTAIESLRLEQQRLRHKHSGPHSLMTLTDARAAALKLPYSPVIPRKIGLTDLEISRAQAREWINWRAFFSAWGLDASFASIAYAGECDHCRAQWLASVPENSRIKAAEAMQLWKEANRILDASCKAQSAPIKARVVLIPAGSATDDTITALNNDGTWIRIPTLRSLTPDTAGHTIALSDFIAPSTSHNPYPDFIGFFAVTSGEEFEMKASRHKELGDDYTSILYRTLADRLVEAATEIMHHIVRKSLWGYAPDESEEPRRLLRQDYTGIRPAIGYPSLPDQSIIFTTDSILHYSSMGIALTENGAMYPAASTTGLILAHPDSHYFILGDISGELRDDYAIRRNMKSEDIARFIPTAK